MNRKVAALVILVLLVGTALFVILSSSSSAPVSRTSSEHQEQQNAEENLPENEPKSSSLTFVAVGDILIHDDHYNDAKTTEGYDFSPMFKRVAPIISAADIAMLNQETPVAGEALGLSGLYVANSPTEVVDAEIEAGFDVFQLANNHVWDRGEKGLESTLKNIGRFDGTITTGAYTSKKQRDTIPVVEKNGIRVAFLTYTYGTNLGPPTHDYNVNMIDRSLISKDVSKAKKVADAVVVGVHWGVEKDLETNGFQTSLASFLADEGVDVVVGTHPHVLQAPEWLEGKSGNKTFVMYSLGNFLSVHTEKVPYTLTGAIAGLEIHKDKAGKIEIKNPFYIPTWTNFDSAFRNFEVIPFDDLSQDEFWYSSQDVKTYLKEVKRRLSKNVDGLIFEMPLD